MAKRKAVRSNVDNKKIVVKPTQIIKKIDCTINSSYIIENPELSKFTTTILLNGEKVEDKISNVRGRYTGIKMIQKNSKFIIYTGKHGLTSSEDVTSGVLTIQFMEI